MRKLIVAIVLSLCVTSVSYSREPSVYKSIPNSAFTKIEDFPITLIAQKARRPVEEAKPIIKKIRYKPTVADAKAYALNYLGAVQYSCFNKLMIRESNWNPFDLNKSSGAYGIPQALPGSKMSAAGADWRTNPVTQVRWAIEIYIPHRYGTACRALEHSYTHGWY